MTSALSIARHSIRDQRSHRQLVVSHRVPQSPLSKAHGQANSAHPKQPNSTQLDSPQLNLSFSCFFCPAQHHHHLNHDGRVARLSKALPVLLLPPL